MTKEFALANTKGDMGIETLIGAILVLILLIVGWKLFEIIRGMITEGVLS